MEKLYKGYVEKTNQKFIGFLKYSNVIMNTATLVNYYNETETVVYNTMKIIDSVIDLHNILAMDYGRTTDEKILEYLENIKIVVLQNKGIDTIYGYYPCDENYMNDIKNKKRKSSLLFSQTTESLPILGLEGYKNYYYLNKSNSIYSLKPDIGEIFDAIPDYEFGNFKYILLIGGYTKLNDDGENLLTVELFN